jgi:mannose-6-phosphate isomerase
VKLETRSVEKTWGRTELPPTFAPTGGRRIGEIWFSAPDAAELPLLVKYIFTSEALSIQVHPNDAQARERGLAQGKSECWYIIDAEPDATLGLGLKAPTNPETLRAAALDGSIETLMDWKPVEVGDFFSVPAGTVHAIGGGISLLEVQQNSDVTYRLYDYGRPRELHLDDGIAVSKPLPYDEKLAKRKAEAASFVLVSGPQFTLLRLDGRSDPTILGDRLRWAIPIGGSASSGADSAGPGECLLIAAGDPLEISPDALVMLAAPGSLA